MDKGILQDYVDACELIKETEQDIQKLKRKKKTIIQTNVKGSNPNFPYQEQHFKIQGTPFTYSEDSILRMEEKLLEERRAVAEEKKRLVEESFHEVILATNPTVEGDATANYIAEICHQHNIKVSRIAHGIPVGGELETVDGTTLTHSFLGRRQID